MWAVACSVTGNHAYINEPIEGLSLSDGKVALAVGAERPVTRHLMATSASPPRPCSTSVSASHDRVRARTNEPLALHGVPTAAATPIHGSLRRPGPGSKHLDRVVRVSEWAVEPRRRRHMPPTAGRARSWSYRRPALRDTGNSFGFF
jgi:hypothetical protein